MLLALIGGCSANKSETNYNTTSETQTETQTENSNIKESYI